ncbi:MAG: hypothetical protein WBF53_13445 [Litorimonas sp.]
MKIVGLRLPPSDSTRLSQRAKLIAVALGGLAGILGVYLWLT